MERFFVKVSILVVAQLYLLALAPKAAAARSCDAPTLACPAVAGLLNARGGFGRNARGGLDGRFVVVTSPADSGPGTLRNALQDATGPVWITFAGDMAIDLKSQLKVPSNVTIDGRGHKVTLLTYGLTLVFGAHDIILANFTVDGQFREESQAVDISDGAHDVWLHHLTLKRTNDRLVNVKRGATDVTISWVRFENHNKVMLLNNLVSENLFADWDRDKDLRVTINHSYFFNTVQRNPRAQLGYTHFYNNLLENWDFYGMSFSLEARALIEGNIFSNVARRPCVEPPVFKTIEKVDKNYCDSIPTAPGRTALPNGEVDREEYEKYKKKYNYTHDYRAFIKIRDNLYLGEAKEVLTDYKPEKVLNPGYCYAYDRPGLPLAEKIRALAGASGATREAGGPETCPVGDRAQTISSRPAGGGVNRAEWRAYSEQTTEYVRRETGFYIGEKPGPAAEHGALQYFYGAPDRRWRVTVSFRPVGGRGVAIYFADQKDQKKQVLAACDMTATRVLHAGQGLPATASQTRNADGSWQCVVEGQPSASPGQALRLDVMTYDAAARSPFIPGEKGKGLEVLAVEARPEK